MIKLTGLMTLGLSIILLCGCGDDNDTPIVQQPTIQGVVIGSHYEGVWVCVDLNSNARCDGEEIKTVSDANGNWTLNYPQNRALSVVAEIYVDNIKHSNYSVPPSTTLVEKPMIFIAPLQGEVDDQLIVSPISTMVYRSMQENGTSFEVAKESVANEVGVSSDVLLTNYNVGNFSPDHIALQQRSAVEIEKLELTMTYHDNWIGFTGAYNMYIPKSGHYVVKDYYIPSAQDPNHHIYIGKKVNLQIGKYVSDGGGGLDFVLGRKGSTNVANYWKNRVHSDWNNYNDDPDKLNFAMQGTFTLSTSSETYVLSDFFLAQGHTWNGNNWWIGGPGCRYHSDNKNGVTCEATASGLTWFIKFEMTSTSSFQIINISGD